MKAFRMDTVKMADTEIAKAFVPRPGDATAQARCVSVQEGKGEQGREKREHAAKSQC
jgi:hypothetical protein